LSILASNNFCDMSMCVSIAQARTNCASRSWSAPYFLDKFSHTMAIERLLWHVHLRLDCCASSHKLCVPILAPALFLQILT
jgi:hypothetical protein